MRSIDEFPVVLQEAWAAHHVLRSLGFSAENLWFAATNEGVVATVLRAQDKQFVWLAGMVKSGEETAGRFRKQWTEMVDSLGKQPSAELERALHGSRVWREKVQLVAELMLGGFVFPGTSN